MAGLTEPRCIGTAGPTQANALIISPGTNGTPWYPSALGEEGANSTLSVIEVFWYAYNTTVTGRRIIDFINTSNAIMLRLDFQNATTFRIQFRESATTTNRTIVIPSFPIAANLNVWWHTVLYPTSNNTWSLLCGRVGRAVDGSATTADTLVIPITYLLGTVTISNANENHMHLRGFRSSASASFRGAFGCGINSATSGGNAVIATSSQWAGGVAEVRAWVDPPPALLGTGAGSLMDMRDEYIDSTLFPSLVHNWRLNEAFGTLSTGFANMGFRNALFGLSGSTVAGAGFNSTPIPPLATGVDLQAVTQAVNNASISSEPRIAFRVARDLRAVTQAAANGSLTTQNSPTVRRTVSMLTSAQAAANGSLTTQSSPTIRRTVDLRAVAQAAANGAVTTQNSVPILRNQQFSASDTVTTSENTPHKTFNIGLANNLVQAANDAALTTQNQPSAGTPVRLDTTAQAANNAAVTSEVPTVHIDIAGLVVLSNAGTPSVATTSEFADASLDFFIVPTASSAHTGECGSGWFDLVASLSPSLYWKMEESGVLVQDSSGNGNGGTISGPFTQVAGITPATSSTGFAIRSDSLTTVATCSNTATGDPHPTTNEFTVIVSVLANTTGGFRGITSKPQTVGDPIWFIAHFGGLFIAQREHATGNVQIQSGPTSTTIPHIVVSTWTPGRFEIYVDGVLGGSDTSTAPTITTPLAIAHMLVGTLSGDGVTFDDFIVLDHALSTAEVVSLHSEWKVRHPEFGVLIDMRAVTQAAANAAVTTQGDPTIITGGQVPMSCTAQTAIDAMVLATQNAPSLISSLSNLRATEQAGANQTTATQAGSFRRAVDLRAATQAAANAALTSEVAPSLDIAGLVTFSATANPAALTTQNQPTMRVARPLTMPATTATTTQNTPTTLLRVGFTATNSAETTENTPTIVLAGDVILVPIGSLAVTSEGPQATDEFADELALNFTPTFWWQLDSITGANDSGTALTGGGTLIGASLGSSGLISQEQTSALFDVTADRVESNNTTSWQTTNVTHSYTLGAWFRLNSFSDVGDQFVFSKQAFAHFRVLDDGSCVFSRTNELAAIKEATSAAGVIKVGWTHFVCCVFERVSGQGQKLYIDGALVAQNTDISTQNLPLNRKFLAGRDTDVSGENLDGRVQHVFLINQVPLSQANIATLLGAAATGASAGTTMSVERRFSPPASQATTSEPLVPIAEFSLSATIREREYVFGELLTLEEYMSVLDIWNVALTRLGIEPVTSAPASDGSPQGVILAANWPLFKESFLRDDAWDGGKKTAVLSTFKHADGTTSVTPAGTRWTNAYQLPSDHVRSLRLNGWENRPGPKDLGGLGLWEEEVVTNDAGTRKRCLLADDATAELEYVFLVPDADITLMPADMRWAMAMALAAHVSTSFGKTTNEVVQLEQQAEVARRNARRTDAQTGAKPTITDTTLADSFY